MTEIRIATRRSRLALAQATRVSELLRSAHPDSVVRLVEVETEGDRDQTSSIAELSEVGAFVRSVQSAVLDGRADLAVHSLKDLPVGGPEELELAALPERRSPFDAMVGSSLDRLKPGSVVGTSSPRRAAQLLRLRPDLVARPLRGNVETRLRKVAGGAVQAAVLAEAGLARLGKADQISERLDVSQMVPAPGQGALAAETRKGSDVSRLVAAIDNASLRTLLSAERLLLAETGAGCRSALGALARWEGGRIRLDAFVDDDRGPRRTAVLGDTPEAVVKEARTELEL